jgi:hypothetical protein
MKEEHCIYVKMGRNPMVFGFSMGVIKLAPSRNSKEQRDCRA